MPPGDREREKPVKAAALLGRIVYGLCLIAVGAALAFGGVKLIVLGGSFYYLPAGLAALASGAMVIWGRWRTGALIYLALMAVTLVWALAEAGLDGWALAPRLISPFVLGLPFLIGAWFGKGRERLAGLASAAVAIVLVAAVWFTSGFAPVTAAAYPAPPMADASQGDWTHFGNGTAGTHFSPLTAINAGNAGRLKVAWSIEVGPMPAKPIGQNQTVPLKVGDHLYVCTAFNDVLDLDPETGKTRWQFRSGMKGEGLFSTKCRGVSYYAVPGAAGACSKRVYTAANDGRLFALDADTGKLCASFGTGGVTDLNQGLEEKGPGYYRVSSAPAVVGGKLIFGGAVADGQMVGEPSGVVRAYDAVTGKLAWAWDPGNPGHYGEPDAGKFYVSGTPNAWGPISADEALGLVYVPTGNATPDYWGGHRSAESNKYASSVVALDAATGAPRWNFQTTHYDVWDYDVASQPVLFDLRTAQGVVPALLQPTKRGQLFVLDRRTGKPIFPVAEKPAPQRGAAEKLSPTQPWSVAMPNLGGPPLTESRMWGLTALDQLWCRIKFREARYDGSMTPPGVTYSIQDPGYIGGVNWGSATIDTGRQLAFLVSNRIVNYIRLVPRGDPTARGLKPDPGSNLGGLVPQQGTPYAAEIKPFLSPLGVPCQAPPHGLINAIDLRTGHMVWNRPLGSARDLGPMRIPSHFPFTIGTPTFGGAMSTAGGLVFAGASQDHAFRAFDSATGKLLFEADLPGLSATRPMTFRSERSGRQFVVVASEAPAKGGQSYGAITAFVLATD
jgi:quinoprotein glucose dehydrogenase